MAVQHYQRGSILPWRERLRGHFELAAFIANAGLVLLRAFATVTMTAPFVVAAALLYV